MSTRILALDTSDRGGTVAALDATDGSTTLVQSRLLDAQRRTAVTLLPAIEELLHQCGWQPQNVELVCTTTGPGSFTGLRIAVTAAKTFAYAVGAQLASVSTLATIAAQVDGAERPIWAILSAQRGELFGSRFATAADVVARCGPADANAAILGADDWLGQLAPGDVVAGPPLNRLKDRLPAGVDAADESVWQPLAATVGGLGYQLYSAGKTVDPIQLTPHYVRRSAAEEKADR